MEKKLWELTTPQNSILITEQFYKGCSINTISATVLLDCPVDISILKKAIFEFVKQNDSLRLHFVLQDNVVKQFVDEFNLFTIPYQKLNSKEDLSSMEKEFATHIFDVFNMSLFEFSCFLLPDNTGGFLMNVHHLIGDSWTLGLMASKIIKLYNQFLHHLPIELKKEDSYLDFITTEQEYCKSDRFQKDKAFWNEMYSSIPESATIPSKKRNSEIVNSCKANRKTFVLSSTILERITSFCKENGFSTFNFFMAIYAIYIGKISNLQDFVIGTPILNRSNVKEKNTTGMYINMAPLRIRIDPFVSFCEFASSIAKDCFGILRHQRYSYQSLLEDLRQKDISVPNLYNIVLSYQVTKVDTKTQTPYDTKWSFNGYTANDMDIHIYDVNDTGNLKISYDYKCDLYEEEDIVSFHERMLHIIEQILAIPSLCLSQVEIVTLKEKNELLNDFNNTFFKYDSTSPIIYYFEQQAKLHPNSIALTFEGKSMTYKELNEKANSLAYLLKTSGIHQNSIVGILMDRSFEMIISILGILKSGGAYLPIDPEYPNERIIYMLQDSKAEIVLTKHPLTISTENSINLIFVDLSENFYKEHKNNLPCTINPNDLAYIIYTSGSTGNPKGVMIMHKNFSNFYVAMKNGIEYLSNDPLYSIVSITTVSFDIFGFETLISLANGLHLYLTNYFEQKITAKLEKLIADNHINIIQSTPSVMSFHLDNLENPHNLLSLKYIMLAGEPLSIDLVKRIKQIVPDCCIYNGYGPSETTIFSSVTLVDETKEVTIGKPITNTEFYVLDKFQTLLPPYTLGELYIAGDGVGKGYLYREELTKEKFLTNPFLPDSTMYRTGDIGYWTRNGELICKGRMDHQVKLNGLRIELGEIEKKINAFSEISLCAVIKKEQMGKSYLCCFFESNDTINISQLRTFLIKILPNYMIPTYLIQIDQLPKTPNGKVDRKLLQTYSVSNSKVDLILPETTLENTLYSIIKSSFNIENFSITDSFFAIGLDSLSIIHLSSMIMNQFNVEISVKQIYDSGSVRELAKIIEHSKKSERNLPYIKPTIQKSYYNLSSAQQRIYMTCKLASDSIMYHMPGYIKLPSSINLTKLNDCFNHLLERHEILRTSFIDKDGIVYQIVKPYQAITIPLKKITNSDWNSFIENFITPFDLSESFLFNIQLVQVDLDSIYLFFDIHHIICDGLSLTIFFKELCALYNDQPLTALSYTYKDFCEWEKELLTSSSIEKEKEFWKTELIEIPTLNLPTDMPRPIQRSFNGNFSTFKISKTLKHQIENFCNTHDLTAYMFFLACYHILLANFCMQDEIITGSPIENRFSDSMDSILGMFVNNIVTKTFPKADKAILSYLEEVKTSVLKTIEHHHYPFNELVSTLNITRESSRNPIFDVMFIYQNTGNLNLTFEEKTTDIIPIDTHTSKFDLSFEITPTKEDFCLKIEYSTDLFFSSTIDILFETYCKILDQVLKNSEKTIGDIELVTDFQKNTILSVFNNTTVDYPSTKSLVTLFENQVISSPNNIAVVFGSESLTYMDLNKKSNQLAHYLIKLGVTPEEPIGIFLDKSLEMIIAILGILKAGCAYVPIDIDYPKERINYMIKDSHTKILLTDQNFTVQLDNNITTLNIKLTNSLIYENQVAELNLPIMSNGSSLAYIMYTSGSTGNPKGTLIEHKSISRLVLQPNYIQFGPMEHILQTGSIVFDACTFEIWAALLHGFKLYLIEKSNLLDSLYLQNYLIEHSISILWLTAPLFNQLSEENPHMFHSVKYLLTGGDVLSPKHINMVKAANPNLTIINGYGPTENTTFSCCFPIEKQYDFSIPIGYPISNSTAYVISTSGSLLPIGFVGELWVGGDGVSRGYLNNPKLTQEKFIKNPFSSGYIYKTGDLVKWSNDGTIEFLGRLDSQVKIRGFRVELNEITSKVCTYPNVKECTTTVQTIHNEKSICCYIVSDKELDISDLKIYLKASLPNYMIPNYFMQLPKLPLTTNGKIEKKSLPTDFRNFKTSSTALVKPHTKEEEILLEIYQKILNFKEISTTDSFFDLGGDSLAAMKLQIEALSKGLKLLYADIFKYPSIQELAKFVNKEPSLCSNTSVDYSKYDLLLKQNSLANITSVPYSSPGNVLLTGSTGFLGAHILDSFMKEEQGNIYCLIRNKNNISAFDRLKNMLHFYFNDKYDDTIGNRIHLIEGDITLPNLGLSDSDYSLLGETVQTVIHSAAVVKHYGIFSEFEAVNIKGTERIIEFCKSFNLKLMHISTISVSGNALAEQSFIKQNFTEDKNFDESNFYIGQNIENLYIKSKFLAENLVLTAISQGLNAYILRMGNLTSRFSEGKFQQNHFENAFVNRFKSFLQIGFVPNYLLNTYVEFTPIDYCGDAIIKLASHYSSDYTVFHLLNEKHVTMKKLFHTLSSLGIPLKIISSDEFITILNSLLMDDSKKSYLEGIINDLDHDKKLVYETNIKIKSDFTKNFLSSLGFEWPSIDTNYIYNCLKYLTDIGYFNINLN